MVDTSKSGTFIAGENVFRTIVEYVLIQKIV